MASKILIVEDDTASRAGLVQLLRRAGYDATGAATFDLGRRLLISENPDLLITDLRLEGFNGLQLIITRRRPIPAIVITGFMDRTLEAEAKQLGVDYLIKPVSPSALLTLIEEKLKPRATFDVERRWTRKRVTQGLFAQLETARARVVDVSYGGLRLELPDDATDNLPPAFDVTLPTKDVAVHAELVWRRRTQEGHWLCGAVLSQIDNASAQAWHGLVDAVA
jgi:DNA-binding response OmpR family regulator